MKSIRCLERKSQTHDKTLNTECRLGTQTTASFATTFSFLSKFNFSINLRPETLATTEQKTSSKEDCSSEREQ